MKITVIPEETLIELLYFLAENEKFASVKKMLGKDITPELVGSALRELAEQLTISLAQKEQVTRFDDSKNSGLSDEARKILSSLSPREERRLYKVLGLTESK
ncbi:hypothetical protein KKA47_07430 [bacterium]|nr:hypothetical protein [bacterium]